MKPEQTQVMDPTLVRTQVMDIIEKDFEGRFLAQQSATRTMYQHFEQKSRDVEDQLGPIRKNIHELSNLAKSVERLAGSVETLAGSVKGFEMSQDRFLQNQQVLRAQDELKFEKMSNATKAAIGAAVASICGLAYTVSHYVFGIGK